MHIHRNSQWLVTHEGIEATTDDPGYWIDMNQLTQETVRREIVYYDWPLHLAEKDWVEIPLFLEAFVHALRFYAGQSGKPIDDAKLGRTCVRAMETQ